MGLRIALLLLAVVSGAAFAQTSPHYFRIDTGYSVSRGAALHDASTTNAVICADPACVTKGPLGDDVGTSTILGAGFGYRYSEQIRADATVSFRGGFDVQGTDAAGTRYQSNIKSWAMFVNGYWDFLGNADSFQPYLGLGVGVAKNKTEELTGTRAGVPFNYPGGGSKGMAFQASLGAAIRVSPQLLLDFGYRYVDLGDLKTDPGPANAGLTGKLRAHELQAGIRF